ncbi:hypothetical protein O6H91_16G013600 [Diphasiastrum complanatum]|uniref:Uncharacterized protein n=1 Tax=Diphasiastrum complanatum TaxID=34168 RepID=A0ACC2B9Z4_DIPCM|nr:hypothetical protein O6H91_16G013600 [Diphasiastrum complanatum]
MALRTLVTRTAAALKQRCQPHLMQSITVVLSRRYSSVPDDLKYSKSHEWVKVDGDTAVIGITDHAQHELGDVVFADLPDTGTSVSKGDAFAVVESVKAASDVYSPVSGQVLDINATVKDTPALVNKAPFTDGWLIKVQLSDKSELDSLLDAAKYKEHVEHSSH